MTGTRVVVTLCPSRTRRVFGGCDEIMTLEVERVGGCRTGVGKMF